MYLLLSLVAMCALAAALRNFIMKAPWLFYLIALLFDVVLFAQSALSLPSSANIAITHTMMRGNLGVAMFIVVMYIGVLPRDGKLSKWFRPIRAELSIIACILIMGHMLVHLGSYIPSWLAGGISQSNVIVALVIALALTVLIVLLGVTSFRFVKKHMKARSWKKLQTLAYPFYGLVFVHLMLMLGPAAMHASSSAVISVALYCIIFVGYMILRIARAIVDKREKVDLAETVKDQGFEQVE